MERLKIGVVGAGVGRLHLEGYKALPKDVEIVALCDADEARLNELGDAFSIPLRYTDYNQLFNSGEVEAVSLCLPNHLHASVSTAALEAGLHVLCEKPLAENAASGQKIVEAAARAAGKFMICFNRRYRPDLQWMKQVVSAGKLGRIYQIRAGWTRETGIPTRTGWFVDKARSGGGPLIDLGVHILDLVMWLLGYPAILTISADVQANFGPHGRKVWYRAGDPKMPPYSVEDSATAFIRLANNISFSLETSWASHAKPGMDDYFIMLLGTEGTIELYVANYAGEDTLTYYTELDGASVATRPRLVGRQIDHVYAVAEFVRCIQNDLPPTATAEEGLVIAHMIDAIYESAAKRREIVLNLEKGEE